MFLKKNYKIIIIIILALSIMLMKLYSAYVNHILYTDCVAGLISDNNGGSYFVIYNTPNWKSTTMLHLPDVTPDNYAAITNDGNYIAYTKWDTNYIRRYLIVYSCRNKEFKSFFEDMPLKNEIIKISWLPDNETLLFIKNDKSMPCYQEIVTLNVKTGKDTTLVKGEVWRICVAEDIGKTAEDFYLKGQESYLKVKEKKAVKSYNKTNPINPEIEWNYYLNQEDINKIYNYYGGIGEFDINNVTNLMSVSFSAPKVSNDGGKIIYSATLDRNSAPGAGMPLWMCSAIWVYDIKSSQSSIIYSQNDCGAIGRVDWVDIDEITFVSYYDFQGSRDSINYYNLSSKKYQVIFPYSEQNYNNVTLLPVGNRQITFTSSKKNDSYEESSTILFNIDSNTYGKLNIKFKENNVLLENFVYLKMKKKT